MPDSAARYDVFLSYSSVDKPSVELLARRLREEAGLSPFLDKWHLIPGEPWQEALEEALAQSATVAVFIGPSDISPWHNAEMRAALDRAVRTREKYRVIPVLLPGAQEKSVSPLLAQRVWVDFRSGLDDDKAFARLVAGIKGEAIEGQQSQDEAAVSRGTQNPVPRWKLMRWSLLGILAFMILIGVGIYAVIMGSRKPVSVWPQVQVVGPLVLEIGGQGTTPSQKVGHNCSSGMPTPGDHTTIGTLISPGSMVTITFAIRNDGAQIAEALEIVAAVRGPNGWGLGWNAPVSDFPRISGFVLAPGQTYVYQRSRAFYKPGEYFVAPTLKNRSQQWGGIAPWPVICFVIADN
jgi:hypothetical protein